MIGSQKLNIGIITQARTTSTRLPAKVFKTANSKSLLQHHIDRLRKSDLPIYIATTTNSTDDPIADFAEHNHLSFWRGSETNVLQRYYDCASHYKLDVIVRVTSDCPLIDGEIIKQAVDEYLIWNDKRGYYSNGLQRTFPRGFDFEIFNFSLLKEAFLNAEKDYQKEHVTPYLHQNSPGNIHIKQFIRKDDASKYRLTVDTEDDYILIKKLIEEFDAANKNAEEIIAIMNQHPELNLINAHIEQKKL